MIYQEASSNSTSVAIDTLGESPYSDMIWSANNIYEINTNINWRFYINPLTNFTLYENSFTLVHSYDFIGLYNITLNFMSSNKILVQTINITDCNILRFFVF